MLGWLNTRSSSHLELVIFYSNLLTFSFVHSFSAGSVRFVYCWQPSKHFKFKLKENKYLDGENWSFFNVNKPRTESESTRPLSLSFLPVVKTHAKPRTRSEANWFLISLIGLLFVDSNDIITSLVLVEKQKKNSNRKKPKFQTKSSTLIEIIFFYYIKRNVTKSLKLLTWLAVMMSCYFFSNESLIFLIRVDMTMEVLEKLGGG